MKTARFLFTAIVFGALTPGVSLATPPSGEPSGKAPVENQTAGDHATGGTQDDKKPAGKDQAYEKHSKSEDDGRSSEKSSQTAPVKKTTPPAHPPSQVADVHGNAEVKRADNPPNTDFHKEQPVLHHPSTPVAKVGLKTNRAAAPPQPIRTLPVAARPVVPLHAVVPARSATTASIGGLAPSSAKTSAAGISGTGMKLKRKPY